MSEYIKLEDALKEFNYGTDYPVNTIIDILYDLPTIEVSEDMVSRKDFEDVIKRMGERNCFTCGVYHDGEWTLMGRNPEKVTAEELDENDRAVSLAEVCKIIQDTYEVCPTTWGRLRNLPSIEVSEEQLGKLQASENSVENTTVSEDFTSISRANSKLEVCEDCISREFALKVIDDCINYPTNGDKACAIKNAPSVVPRPKEGKRSRCIWCDSPYRIEYNWIDREGNTASFADEDRHLVATGIANYCPNCGMKMKGDKE